MNAEKILKRFKAAQKRKVTWEETYREAMEYVAPQRETFDEEFKGQRKDGTENNIYDSTGQQALVSFVSNLQSSLVPPMRKWVDLQPSSVITDEEERKQVYAGLQNVREIMFNKLHRSNFDTQIAETFFDLGLGTGALLVFKGTRDDPFRFVNVPLSQLYLEEGPHQRVTTVFRKFKVAGRNVPEQWPDAKLSSDLQKMLVDKPDEELEFVEMTTPEKISQIDPETKKLIEVDGYSYCVVSCKTKDKIVERMMRTSPWVTPRWSNLPNEVYGRGPVLTALPDIKSLNATKRILLQYASIATFGMYTITDDVNADNIRLGPAHFINVRSNGGGMAGPSISPLPLSGRPDLSQIVIRDLQSSINAIMFGDPLGDVNLPVKTATEMSLRQQELSKRIGSAFGKLQYELIIPLVQRLLDIMLDLGLIEGSPLVVKGELISIEPTSPLATAQDEEDVVRHIRYVETLVGLFGPEIGLAMINPENFGSLVAEKLGIDPDVPITKEQAEQIRATAQQMIGGQGVQQAA